MKRIISLLAAMAIMAAMMVAVAVPAFANSFASDANHNGIGPRNGNNFGTCKYPLYPDTVGPGNGTGTAVMNPSYHGGPNDNIEDNAVLCPKPRVL